MQRTGRWMQTYNGRKFYPDDPRPEDFHIEDIAHALSLICRFNGHCTKFYSVAQHSLIMSQSVFSEEHALWALMHDAAEAYIGDLIRPVKRGDVGVEFINLENLVLSQIAVRFGLPWPMPEEIQIEDDRILATEARDLMGGQIEPWDLCGAKPYGARIRPYGQAQAKMQFLDRYKDLTCGRKEENVTR